ncbi:MAG: NAD(+)/NADH kinase [Candidatus Delongbacteria bacterium]|nr:NAD(+)/NADH kinase [Candidatus Delongbacteria bacterium]
MKYGIIDNLKDHHDSFKLSEFFAVLKETGLEFSINREKQYSRGFSPVTEDKTELIEKSDVIIVLGGDGSMLEAASHSAESGKPFIGVNYGKLGFLADVKENEIIERIRQIEKGQFFIEERIMLNAYYEDHEIRALNDIVLDRGYSQRVLKVSVDIDGKFFTTYTSDGVIVSTPTGSTAYNMSAHGPIMQPGVPAFVLTAMSPHALAMRPIVIPDSSVISLTAESNFNEMILSGDGQESINIPSYAKITVKKAPYTAKFIKFPDSDYYHLLREKLGWGGFKERVSK